MLSIFHFIPICFNFFLFWTDKWILLSPSVTQYWTSFKLNTRLSNRPFTIYLAWTNVRLRNQHLIFHYSQILGCEWASYTLHIKFKTCTMHIWILKFYHFSWSLWIQNRIMWESYLLSSLTHSILSENLKLLLWCDPLLLLILRKQHRLIKNSAVCLCGDSIFHALVNPRAARFI